MRPKKYLNDEVHGSLKDVYSIIKDRSDFLITNLEELRSRQLINPNQYVTLQIEYSLINKSATNLLANRSETHISEEHYKELKDEYTKKQSDALFVIGGIKADVQKSLNAAENEQKRYNNEFEKIKVKFDVGEIKYDGYDRLQRQYQNKIEKSKKSISELKSLVEAKSSNDIVGIGITSITPFQVVPKPLSTIALNDNISKNPGLSLSSRSRNFISEMIERYLGLSPFLKILAGLVTSSLLAVVWLMVWSAASNLLALNAALSGNSGVSTLIIFIGYAIAYIGAILIEIAGIIMIIYGVRDLWQRK